MPSKRFPAATRRLLAVTAAAAALAAALPAFALTKGSGALRSQPRQLDSFDIVSVSDGIDLDLRIGPQAAVVVEADDNLLGLIDSEVRGNTLVLSSHGSWSSARDPVVHVTVPRLARLESSGSGSANLQGLTGDALEIHASGSGRIAASGRVQWLDLELDGSSNADLQKLDVAQATVVLDGSGDADVSASDSLDATVNGSGNVRYASLLKHLAPHVNGTGKVRQR